MKYTSKEALDNIVVEFDEMGMICSNIAYKDFWEKDLHFKEIFGCEYEIIMKDLKRLEQLEKIIKENFGYNENTKECFFNYDAPVMEEEIKEALGYE